jgi:hypothetical protein
MMKLKVTSVLYICMILTGLASVSVSPVVGQESITNFERYIQTFQYKVPVWRDGQWKTQLRCLTIPYDSRGRVPFLRGFEGHCDAVEIGDRKHQVTLGKDVHILVIDWRADSTDGSLELTVLPNFIYLRTSHVNPNPDRFLWYRYISEPQYAAFAKFFEESIKDGKLSLIEESEPDSANWTPTYAENFSVVYGENGTQLGGTIWKHYISANVNYLFDQANRHLPHKETWLWFPDWKDYGEQELGILYATYMPDELEGGAGFRVIPPDHGVYISTHTIWGPADKPLSFSVSNEDEKEIHFLVNVEFLDGEKVVGRSSDILGEMEAGKGLLRLASHSNQTFTWNVANLDKKWGRGGEWQARLKLSYGYGSGSSTEATTTSEPLTLGYPETLDDIFNLREQRETLLELYYRLKERQLHEGYSSLSRTEALLVDLWDLQGFFGHSAWEDEQYFVYHGDRAPEAVADLSTIGANCLAKRFNDIIGFFPGRRIPVEPEEVGKIMKTWGDDKGEQLTDLGECFWAKYDRYEHAVCSEDLNQLLYKYVLEHRADIH